MKTPASVPVPTRLRLPAATESDARQRFALAARASTMLSRSLDRSAIVTALGRLMVPELAEWCAIDLLESDGQLMRVSLVHADPTGQRPTRRMTLRGSSRSRSAAPAPHPDWHPLRGGRPRIIPRVTPELLDRLAQDAEQRDALIALGVHSGMTVPLIARGKLLGTVVLMVGSVRPPLSQDEMLTAGELARSAAAALTNAELYRAVRRAEEQVRHQLQFVRAITANLGEGICALDRNGNVTFANPAAAQLLGWPEAELLGKSLPAMMAALPRRAESQLTDALHRVLVGSGTWHSDDLVLQRRNRTRFTAACTLSPIILDARCQGAVLAFRDISARKRAERELTYRASHDALTGLINRQAFMDELALVTAEAARNQVPAALLCLDLDGFKAVNDTYGHPAGDELLRAVARRLRNAVRPQDTVSRFGGDEFAILMNSITDPADTGPVARRIARRLAPPFVLGQAQLHLSCSIGVAPVWGDVPPAEVVRRADAALYEAKAARRGQFEVWQDAAGPLQPGTTEWTPVLRSVEQRG